MGEPVEIVVEGTRLSASISRPPMSATKVTARFGLILCHGFPIGPWGPATTPDDGELLADRLAGDAGWVIMTLPVRGGPGTEGPFSVRAWLGDMRVAVDNLLKRGPVEGVWLAGFSVAGTIAIAAAGLDGRVRGVAAFAAPADLHEWSVDPRRTLEHFRSLGLATNGRGTDAWLREFKGLKPLDLIARLPPRPVLLVHGADDEIVPVVDARALADAAAGKVDLRVLSGAGHGLRYDPRAIAILLGWMDRQAM